MALPQKAIEQLSREPAKTPGWSGRVLMVTGTIFFASLLVYLGLQYGYIQYLISNRKQVDLETTKFTQEVSVMDQEQTIEFYSQLRNVEKLFATQPSLSEFLRWFEAHTQGNISYVAFKLSVPKKTLGLSGIAKTIPDLGQQLKVFETVPEVTNIEFGGSRYDAKANWYEFDLTLTLDPGAFGAQNPEIDE